MSERGEVIPIRDAVFERDYDKKIQQLRSNASELRERVRAVKMYDSTNHIYALHGASSETDPNRILQELDDISALRGERIGQSEYSLRVGRLATIAFNLKKIPSLFPEPHRKEVTRILTLV